MSTTSYKGINYAGHTGVNQDKANGIRYGVMPQNEVLQAWADSSEAQYPKREKGERQAAYERRMEFAEPIAFTYEREGYAASCGEDGDIFIVRSPYFTYAQFCSPCAPGACYLRNPLDEPDENNKAYCFGHDWFEGRVAPYPVYSVETGELVPSET